MEVGKEVMVAGVGGLLGGYMHVMFLQPYFAAQMVGPIQTTTLVDLIVAFIIGVATTMYAVGPLAKLFGYGLAGTLAAVGLMQQFGILPTAAAVRVVRTPGAVRRVPTPARSRFTPTAPAQISNARYTITA